MKQDISALMDGEIHGRAVDALIQHAGSEEELKDCWATYHLIGDTLREGYPHHVSLQARICARLAKEPIVPAPRLRRSRLHRGLRVGMAVAASVATVSIVLWMARQEQGPAFKTAGNNPVQVASTNAPAPQPTLTPPIPEMNEYLQAHEEVSPSGAGYQLATMRTAGPAAGVAGQ